MLATRLDSFEERRHLVRQQVGGGGVPGVSAVELNYSSTAGDGNRLVLVTRRMSACRDGPRSALGRADTSRRHSIRPGAGKGNPHGQQAAAWRREQY
jgi:hypothetical protein